MTTADILRGAKARLIRIGWGKGDAECIAGRDLKALRCCAATAIAMTNNVEFARLSEIGKFFVEVNGIDKTRGIAYWNDAPERTIEDVLAAYDKAIAAAEALEQPT